MSSDDSDDVEQLHRFCVGIMIDRSLFTYLTVVHIKDNLLEKHWISLLLHSYGYHQGLFVLSVSVLIDSYDESLLGHQWIGSA